MNIDPSFIAWFNKLPIGFIAYMYTNYVLEQQEPKPITNAEVDQFTDYITKHALDGLRKPHDQS